MNDKDCTTFLQWALPQLSLRWAGFRKVRGQVRKRLKRRMNDLGLADLADYRARLEADPAEWRVLDECCHITISRFFRDKGVFEVLRRHVLPEIAARAGQERRDARIWSVAAPLERNLTRSKSSGILKSRNPVRAWTSRSSLLMSIRPCSPARGMRALMQQACTNCRSISSDKLSIR